MRAHHSVFVLLLTVSVQWTLAIDVEVLKSIERVIEQQESTASGVVASPSFKRMKEYVKYEMGQEGQGIRQETPGQEEQGLRQGAEPVQEQGQGLATRRIFSEGFAAPFIVGGTEAQIIAFPHLASLQIDVNNAKGSDANPPIWFHFCGANLISERWLLTAAHCTVFFDIANHRVRLGVGNLNDPENEGQNIAISSAIQHPDFFGGCANRKSPCYPNDIAALRMRRPAVLGPTVKPIRLPTKNQRFIKHTECKVAGFGATFATQVDNVKLLEIDAMILPNDVCNCNWLIASQNAVFDGHLCRYDPDEKTSACFGDSGSAVICRKKQGNKRSAWVMASHVTWGDDECLPRLPNVDTRTSFHCNWIKSVTGVPKRCGY